MATSEALERLARLEENLSVLRELKDTLSPDVLDRDIKSQWLIRYLIFLSQVLDELS